MSPALHPPERPSHTHSPKPAGFGGSGHDVLSTIFLVSVAQAQIQSTGHQKTHPKQLLGNRFNAIKCSCPYSRCSHVNGLHLDFSRKYWDKQTQRNLSTQFSVLYSSCAAGNKLTINVIESYAFVPRARYLRLLRRRGRQEPLYHSVLRLCSEFCDSRPFLWLDIKKSIHGNAKISPQKKCGEMRQGPRCLV